MPAKLSWFAVAVTTILPIAFACGGDDGPEYVIRPDAPPPDAMEPCKGAAMYQPTFAADDQEATDYPAMGTGEEATLHEIFFLGTLDAAAPADYLYLDLYEMYGAFDSGPIKTGTFPITEDDKAYSTCGMCVMIGADVSEDGTVDDWYFANSGVVTLTSVTGRLTGSLQNVMLYRMITDSNGNPSDTPTYDCETRLVSASFDTPIVAAEL